MRPLLITTTVDTALTIPTRTTFHNCSARTPAWTVIALADIDGLEFAESVVAPDTFFFCFICLPDDLARVVTHPDNTGSTSAEYGGGFSRARCPGGAITSSIRTPAAFPVGLDVITRLIWPL